MKRARFAIRAGCLAALMAGILWNLRFTVADFWGRRNLPDSTRLAMRVVPNYGVYPAQLADEIYANDPESAKALLQRAVKLNRYDAASWIQLGLLCEAANDLPRAEEALLQAGSVDATFLPSWSLANFYFRRENAARFWYWARKAAQMAPDDATALFRLAWYVSPNAPEIETRLQMKRPVVEGQFVNFLLAQGDPKAVADAASHLLAAGGEESTATLLGACDWLLQHKRPDLALPLWKALGTRISYAPSAGRFRDTITNGSFNTAPLSHGFDWHLNPVEGVSSYLNFNPNELGFEFSGDEPDGFLLLSQIAPVESRGNYVLTVDYRTSGLAPRNGMRWVVSDNRSGRALASSVSLSAEQGGEAATCFTVPDGAGFVDLTLLYQRERGTIRVEGKLALKQVRLTTVTAEDCKEKKSPLSGADSPAF